MATTQRAGEGYEVGHGKPPADPKFTPATAYRGGRPKGSKNKPKPGDLTPSERMALEENKRIVQAGTRLTAGEVVERAQIKTAATGGTNAQKAYLARIAHLEQKERDAIDKRLSTWEEYVRLCEELLDRASPERREQLERAMLPHPGDVEADFAKREVRILGPATSFERRQYAAIHNELSDSLDYILRVRAEIEANQTDWSLQAHYIEAVSKYADTAALFPERHRPPRVSPWPAAQTFPWWYDPASGYEPPACGRRRVRANRARLPLIDGAHSNTP